MVPTLIFVSCTLHYALYSGSPETATEKRGEMPRNSDEKRGKMPRFLSDEPPAIEPIPFDTTTFVEV